MNNSFPRLNWIFIDNYLTLLNILFKSDLSQIFKLLFRNYPGEKIGKGHGSKWKCTRSKPWEVATLQTNWIKTSSQRVRRGQTFSFVKPVGVVLLLVTVDASVW